MLAKFSVFGFLVGLICAILLVSIGPEILSFNHARLVFGVLALILWYMLSFTVGGAGYNARR